MVSVCCGCDGLYPWFACLVGGIGGLFYILASNLMIKIKVDDPIDAVAVHGAAGN